MKIKSAVILVTGACRGELAAHPAGKAAAWSLTDALRHELAPQKSQAMGLQMASDATPAIS